MGACYSAEVRERSQRRRKIKRSRPVKIKVTPPTPERKTRNKEEAKEIVENTVKRKNKKTADMNTAGQDTPSSSQRDHDRFASLRGQDVVTMRRASHAGFAAQRLVQLERRPSMPAHLLMPDDSQRKLHNSSACVNLIQEFHSMKVVGKDGSEHYVDDDLQRILRKLKKTDSTQAHSDAVESAHEDESGEADVKRSASSENINQKEKHQDATELVSARRTSSDTKIGAVDITDPEGDDA